MKKVKALLSIIFAFAMALFVGAAIDGATGDTTQALVCAGVMLVGAFALAFAYGNTRGLAFACGVIAAGIATNCDNIPTPGIRTTVYLANFSDIDTITIDNTNKTLATAITMVAGKKFYAFTGIKKIGKAGYTSTAGNFLNTLVHNAEIIILQNDPTSKGIMDQMVQGNLVLIVENKTKGATGNMKYEIYGRESGLQVLPEKDSDNADLKGGHLLKLSTPEGEQENHLPTTLFMTDESTTDAIITAITT